MKPVNIGVIGAGRMSRLHIRGFQGQEGVEVVAVADTDLERADKAIAEENLSAKAFSDYKEMLAAGGLDAVAIVTPNFLHAPMAIDVLNAGLDVLCEKPMAPTVEACDRMIETADQNERILMVNQSLRYSPLYMKIKELLDAGEIGNVFHARFLRFHHSTPNKGWSPGADWFVDKKAGGGMTNDIGIHVVDFANWCFGKVAKAWGIARTLIETNTADDNVVAVVQYESGCNVTISLSWTSGVGKNTHEFYGPEGSIEGSGSQLVIRKPGEEEPKTIEIPKDAEATTSFEHFIQCVRDRTEPLSSGREARRAVEVTNAVHAST